MKTIHQDDSPQNISEELHTANAVDEGSERSVVHCCISVSFLNGLISL
jgi:hypothetical protein